MSRVGLIWAEARGGIIGARGGMPWHVPEDMAHFRELTGQDDVVMGRRTWESLPPRFRPLPGRRNIVVTSSDDHPAEGAERVDSLDAALAAASSDVVWVIGGGRLYADAIARGDVLEVTRLDLDVDGDTYAPGTDGFQRVRSDPAEGWHTSRTGTRFRFETYERER